MFSGERIALTMLTELDYQVANRAEMAAEMSGPSENGPGVSCKEFAENGAGIEENTRHSGHSF